ncbi:hypothetical protein F5884DRAFT_120418 [Xylogone sp. PMI_703]|nr:hypothetical protein F5884DRAFT_120418 [Xylogone sp. PMI_703]
MLDIDALVSTIERRRKLAIDSIRSKGDLLIGGKSYIDIVEGNEFSDEDLLLLHKHIKHARPRLAGVLFPLASALAELYLTGSLTNEVDFGQLSAQISEALEADRAEAALDNSCI